jgi:hypothetical protein
MSDGMAKAHWHSSIPPAPPWHLGKIFYQPNMLVFLRDRDWPIYAV